MIALTLALTAHATPCAAWEDGIGALVDVPARAWNQAAACVHDAVVAGLPAVNDPPTLGAAADPTLVELRRVRARLAVLRQTVAAVEADDAWRPEPVPAVLAWKLQSLEEREAALLAGAVPTLDSATYKTDIADPRARLLELHAALDGHDGAVGATEWCRLATDLATVHLQDGVDDIAEAWVAQAVSAWPSGCALQGRQAGYPPLTSLWSASPPATATLRLHLEALTAEDDAPIWRIDGTPVDAFGPLEVRLAPGRHRVERLDPGFQEVQAALIVVGGGDTSTLCAAESGPRLASGVACPAWIPVDPVEEPARTAVADGEATVRARTTRLQLDVGVLGGALVGSAATGAIRGDLRVRSKSGTVRPVLTAQAGATSHPIERPALGNPARSARDRVDTALGGAFGLHGGPVQLDLGAAWGLKQSTLLGTADLTGWWRGDDLAIGLAVGAQVDSGGFVRTDAGIRLGVAL